MVQAICAFLEFCYITRRNVIYEKSLHNLRYALHRFHQYREIFREVGVRDNFSLPRQHSLTHYESLIRLFGAPNGVSTSITESKHIIAIKKPWRRSSRNNALGQILQTNLRLSQLAAARADFEARGMLTPLAPHGTYQQYLCFVYSLTANFTAALSPAQPQTQQDDVEPDEDETPSVDESLGQAHLDVKLGQTPGELDTTLFICNHFDSSQSM